MSDRQTPKLNSVYILTTKYEDEDTEIAGVYDSYDTLVDGFKRILADQQVYPAPTDEEVEDLVADLGGHGPDDECDFNGCVFGWERHILHYENEYRYKEKCDGEATGYYSN